MKYYNDLRDYHNQKFINENFKDFLYSNILILSSNNIKIGFPIIQILCYINILELYIIETIRNKKIFNKLEMRKRSDKIKLLYNKILDNIVFYIKEKNVENPIDIMNLLHTIIYNGYLSYNKKFKNMNPDEKDLTESPFQVILGKGVCRNINILATDIFKKLNYESIDIFCTLYNKNNVVCHVITKVKYDNKIYYLDTQNNQSLDLKNNIFKVKNIDAFEPVNIINKQYNNDEIIELIRYYRIKRSIKDLSEIIKNQEINIQESKSESINKLNTYEVYKQNKKLYKKFKKTYL